MPLLATDEQRGGPGSGGITGRGWKPGQSGNAAGRPPAAVDIAALAREHGPRCIEVAAALLDDADPRIRLGALQALLDRGFGRPAQAISVEGDATSNLLQHLLAARTVSALGLAESAQQGAATRTSLLIEATAAPRQNGATPSNGTRPSMHDIFTPADE